LSLHAGQGALRSQHQHIHCSLSCNRRHQPVQYTGSFRRNSKYSRSW